MEFRDILHNWLIDQMKETGRVATITDLAEYLGFSQPVVSNWYNGKFLPNPKNAPILAGKLGPQVYDTLGLARPDKRIREFHAMYDAVPEKHRDELLGDIENILVDRGWVKIRQDPNLDENRGDDQ